MLNEESRCQFEHQLVQLRSSLLAGIASQSAEQKLVELDQAKHARLPRPDVESKPSREHDERELKRIDAALGRMQRRRFGACCRCNYEIDRERLTADPATPFCQDCYAEVIEQRQKTFKIR